MGCCDNCGQVILVLINLLFSLVGAALLVVGCIVRWGTDIMDQYLDSAYNAFQRALEDAGAGDGTISNLHIGDILGDTTIAFIVIGAFFFVLGIVGCIGACCRVKCLLVVYAIILITIFIAEVVFVVLLFTIRSKIDNWIRDPLIEELQQKYTGTNGTDAFTLSVNFIMSELKCCGIDSYTEFANATKWNRVDNSTGQTLVVPRICCKEPKTDLQCPIDPMANNSYIDQGCYKAVDAWITDHSSVLIGVGAGVAAVQLILIIFSIVICIKSRRNDDDKSSYSDDIPIQPYRESKEASGHRQHYSGSPTTPHDVRGYHNNGYGSPDYADPYRGRSGPDPYRGRTDMYQGPPDGYRGSRDTGYQGYR